MSVSFRCAVIRRSVSDLNGISNRRRLVDQLQKTQLKYEEVFLIVEQNPTSLGKNKIKNLKDSNSNLNHESFLLEITSNKTQILQSENQVIFYLTFSFRWSSSIGGDSRVSFQHLTTSKNSEIGNQIRTSWDCIFID